jgi:putative transcriptional regulator
VSHFEQIMEGLGEALAHARGEDIGVVEHVVHTLDVRALRQSLGLSQAAFAKAFEVPLGTLRGWEQGRRTPRGPARVLLQVIEREPDAVRRALALEREEPAR